jgi:hypothetical protein
VVSVTGPTGHILGFLDRYFTTRTDILRDYILHLEKVNAIIKWVTDSCLERNVSFQSCNSVDIYYFDSSTSGTNVLSLFIVPHKHVHQITQSRRSV